jgi:hypothetical protein
MVEDAKNPPAKRRKVFTPHVHSFIRTENGSMKLVVYDYYSGRQSILEVESSRTIGSILNIVQELNKMENQPPACLVHERTQLANERTISHYFNTIEMEYHLKMLPTEIRVADGALQRQGIDDQCILSHNRRRTTGFRRFYKELIASVNKILREYHTHGETREVITSAARRILQKMNEEGRFFYRKYRRGVFMLYHDERALYYIRQAIRDKLDQPVRG